MEIGIRLALGSSRTHLFAMVLRQTGGVALGGALAWLTLGQLLLPIVSSMFYGIGRVEPVILGGVALVSLAIALATTYLVIRPWATSTAIALLRGRP
jgi:ABC-type antimicrobial peptide transport system permease subunit